MKAVQFPLKLSFACTAHKMQGSTIAKPSSLAVDLNSVKQAAQAYVMLSRIQSLDQLFILDKFLSDKIYPSDEAMKELKRLEDQALNRKEKVLQDNTLITSLNIRSLQKHHKNLLNDPSIRGRVIAIQETWCEVNQQYPNLTVPGYSSSLVSCGRGKGIAMYFKEEFQPSGIINEELYQICRVSRPDLDVINVYISRGANKLNFLKDLGSLAKGSKPCIIVGDFNIDFLKNPNETIIKKILSNGFKQMVSDSTHVEGGLLDHVYVRNHTCEYEISVNFPFYSDHGAVSVIEINLDHE